MFIADNLPEIVVATIVAIFIFLVIGGIVILRRRASGRDAAAAARLRSRVPGTGYQPHAVPGISDPPSYAPPKEVSAVLCGHERCACGYRCLSCGVGECTCGSPPAPRPLGDNEALVLEKEGVMPQCRTCESDLVACGDCGQLGCRLCSGGHDCRPGAVLTAHRTAFINACKTAFHLTEFMVGEDSAVAGRAWDVICQSASDYLEAVGNETAGRTTDLACDHLIEEFERMSS